MVELASSENAEARLPSLDCRASSKTSMKYVEKHFPLRIHRRDGTSKLLLGITGKPPKVGSHKQIKVAKDEGGELHHLG
jgi:hypothetical protein